MWLRRSGYFLLFMAALLVQLFIPLRASNEAAMCHAALARGESAASLAPQSPRWDCSGKDWHVASNRTALRFEIKPGQEPPRWLTTRASDFTRITVVAKDKSGSSASKVFHPADLTIGDGVARMYAPIPQVPALSQVFVEIDDPHFAGMVKGAELSQVEPRGTAGAMETFVAILCGLLLAPIVFDLAYYRVLRERFFLWHAAASAMMLTYTATTGGVLTHFFGFSEVSFGPLSNWSFGIAIASAAMFFANFIEPDMLRRHERRAMKISAAACIGISLFEQISPLPTGMMQQVFYMLWIPVLATFVWLMLVVLRRGSRAANYVVLAWLPLAATGLYRILGNVGINPQPVDAFEAFYCSIMLEVMISSLGVADRFLALRRERDRALTEAQLQSAMAGVDALTGLANRRAIDGRFAELFAQGFRTMAVLDLDHFKAINDSHGHTTGDNVLKAVAAALSPDKDTMVLRLGGEEFMLLLRGADAQSRAESRRQAITLRVSALVPGLERPVTASMGMLALDHDGPVNADFSSLYSHCDRLLYEAKANGRNRTMQERLRGFGKGRQRALKAG